MSTACVCVRTTQGNPLQKKAQSTLSKMLVFLAWWSNAGLAGLAALVFGAFSEETEASVAEDQ